ncbi:unknown protein [Seminavis robusta]|uniref:Uncharacterized protein n=1 Tax=Seminavis robusta TaxID=568900 RepID=A0A9N8E2L8_9STRA|nr:unknown protein [Seminavis robusta]|eukprot:Sro482_g151810.1 n/a (533) ;mRNA; r:23924-25522
MRDLCFKCFGIDFSIDWGTSDDADTFISAHVFYKKYPHLCDNTDATKAAGTTLICEAVIEDEIEDYPPSPQDVPLTQVDNDSNDDAESTDSDDNCLQQEAILNCYFHVVHAFSTKRSYVGKMKDKEFAKPKGVAYGHVTNIASTKTVEQRHVITQLYLQDWRENRDEGKAADHLEKEYCRHPKWNWNYACTGEVGVYPSNCPNESFNRHGIKSVATDCSKNASLASFLVHTAPKLLLEDANSRSDPCTIAIPSTGSIFAVAVTGFLREAVDVVELGKDEYGRASSWLCNLGRKIGVPLNDRRIRLVQASSLDGDKRPFEDEIRSTGGYVLPDTVANLMMTTTKTVCHLQWKEGNIVGDCENCVKHLGYNCPGAIYLRSKHNLLTCRLELLRKTNANARGDLSKASARGNTKKLYESGLSASTKRRCLPKMLETFDAYLCTLNHQQLSKLVLYLRLFKLDHKGAEPTKGLTTQVLLDKLIAFYDNPTMNRALLLANYRKPTPYGVVKTIATNLKDATEEGTEKSQVQEKENNK